MPDERSRNEYAVSTLRARDQLESMRDVWQTLQAHPNADFDLYLASIDAAPGDTEPCVVFVNRNGAAVGMAVGRIAPFDFPVHIGYKTLFTVARRTLTVLPGAIQGDFSPEAAELVLETFLDLSARREVDVIRLVDIPVHSPLAALARQRPPLLCRDHVRWSGRHWKILLPDSSDAFFRRLKEKHRRPLRKACALLNGGNAEGLSCERFTRPDQVDRFCRVADQVAQRTYLRRLGASFVLTEPAVRKLRLLAERGLWRAYILYVHGAPAAYWVGTRYGTTFHLDYTGRDPAYSQFNPGTGTILFAKMVEDLCDATGVREIDFGFGDYPYKQRFGNDSEETETLLLFAPTISGMGLNLLRTALAWTEKGLAALLERLGLRARLKRFWRVRLGRDDHT